MYVLKQLKHRIKKKNSESEREESKIQKKISNVNNQKITRILKKLNFMMLKISPQDLGGLENLILIFFPNGGEYVSYRVIVMIIIEL